MKALILAGGSGTRLWPLSREKKPKQFHTFAGTRTLLQMTFDRLDFLKPADIYVSTNASYEKEVRTQLHKIPAENFIIEPTGLRDTGPAIAYGAWQINKKHPDEVMAVIYADHLIQKKEEFQKKLQLAEQIARAENTLNIVEVKARSSNPNLGYVKIGKLLQQLSDGTEIYELDRFVEKPDIETAKKYLLSYKYLWNTGIYVWQIKRILEKFKELAPAIFRAITTEKNYEKCPKISIDYAIMEKVSPKEVRIIAADLGWNDIGNWASLFDEFTLTSSDNYIQAEHVGLDTKGSLIFGPKGKLIVTSGVENMVIVDTPDALLIMPKERAAEVKEIVRALQKKKLRRYS